MILPWREVAVRFDCDPGADSLVSVAFEADFWVWFLPNSGFPIAKSATS